MPDDKIKKRQEPRPARHPANEKKNVIHFGGNPKN